MARRKLTPQEEADAQALAAGIQEKIAAEVLEMARDLAACEDHELLGSGEFAIRDRVHRMGAQALEATVNARKKGVSGR